MRKAMTLALAYRQRGDLTVAVCRRLHTLSPNHVTPISTSHALSLSVLYILYPISLTPTVCLMNTIQAYSRPVDGSIPVPALLYDDESLLATQHSVGLYDG